MAWYFHVVEHEDHSWHCSHGRHVFDVHSTLVEAIDHITVLAAAQRPAEVFVHWHDGHAERLGPA